QRACACGKSTSPDGECEECKQKAAAENSGVLQRQPVPDPQLQKGTITFTGTATPSKDAGTDTSKDPAISGKPVTLKQDDVVSLPTDVVKRDSDGSMHGKIRMEINAHWQFTGGLTGKEGRSG